MKIIDLTPEHEKLYFCCLEDWSDEMKEAKDHKEKWYYKFKNKGIRVKLAESDEGKIGGMIQYIPSEMSFIRGEGLYVVLCIWVHGYKQGRGDFRKRGMGKALLKAAEEDVKQLGAKGLVTWGLSLPFFMKASWFKKHGYKVVDKQGMMRLLWKPFNEDAIPPKFTKRIKKPVKLKGKVDVSVFVNGWCPAQNLVYERTKRAVEGLEDKVEFNEYWTSDKEVFDEWGISDALYVNGKSIRTGPPPSYNKIKKLIDRKVRRLN
ncbi:GNAT family N-acetyltransferase [Bacteroidota bacterium]